MESHDIKKAFPALYAPNSGDFQVVEVPQLSFLMIDGHGDPNDSPAYAAAVEALFSLSYGVRAIAKTDLGRVHTVGPREGQKKKQLSALERMRFEPYTEGSSVQILHVGSHDSEAPVLARLHEEYLPDNGLRFNGKHHEIYLSDPRRTEPAKLRTILRQPFTTVS